MTERGSMSLEVGPLRVGDSDVFLRTDSLDFERTARSVFADLTTPDGAATPDRTVRFDATRSVGPPVTWSIRRDGEPCEMELMDEAVLVHQQWELNRLAIESQPVAIHSAAVARGSRAALLMGASHSGKTTLAGWLAVHHEMEYLTDEVAVIDDEGRVIPFPRPLGVRSDSPLARLATERAPVDSSGHVAYERLVPAGVLGARVGTRPTPVGLLVFPTYRSLAESSVQQLDHADAFERIAALTPGLGTHGRIVFDRLCRMVEDARALAVTYGDVGDAARVVSDALDRSVDT